MKYLVLLYTFAVPLSYSQAYEQWEVSRGTRTIKGKTYQKVYDDFPLCSEVIRKFEADQTKIARETFQNNEIRVITDRETIASRAQNNSEQNGPDLERRNFDAGETRMCFVGQTPIEILGVYKYEEERRSIRRTDSMSELYKYNDRQWNIYILSSTVEYLSENPDYHVDCWAHVPYYYVGEVPYGDTMNTVGVEFPSRKGLDNKIVFEVTPNHRFYTYIGDENCPGDLECNWVSASALDRKRMSLYHSDGGEQAKLTFVSDYQVTDSKLGIFQASKKVYNLSTETYVYYVGPLDKRVLVHNLK